MLRLKLKKIVSEWIISRSASTIPKFVKGVLLDDTAQAFEEYLVKQEGVFSTPAEKFSSTGQSQC